MRRAVAFVVLLVGPLAVMAGELTSADEEAVRVVERDPGIWVGIGGVSGDGAPQLAVVEALYRPRRAYLVLAGERIGIGRDFDGTPSYLFLHPGRYRLEVQLGGYEPSTVDLEVVAGRHYALRGRLERVADEPIERWWRQEPIDRVRRVFAPEGTRPVDSSGPDMSLRADLLSRPAVDDAVGRIHLSVEPAHAAVYIDGRFVGVARDLRDRLRSLTVEPGERVIEAIAPSFVPQRRVVQIGAGEILNIDLKLARQVSN